MQTDIRAYQPFVDGLRAVAILTVVISHVDLPWLAGGYVGVDIFFVISGYLIINQILTDIENKRFSLLAFWARRAWRILPAFLLVMLTVLLLVTTVFIQPEYKDFAKSFFFSALMVVNHHYLAHQGYFDAAAFTKPLLHMWTLAVEEQFYLVAPLTLLGLTAATAKLTPRGNQRAWMATVAGIGVLSFAACVAFTFPSGRANISFYTMPMRGWEFILGGTAPLLARWLDTRPAWIGEFLAAIGFAAIALSVVLYDGDTLYPSYRAAIPAVGAALIIAAGLAAPHNSVARLLAARPLVGIGLVSYPWYLWHWPLISFVRTMNFGGRDVAQELGAAAVALVLAVLTYRVLELPIRQWRRTHGLRPMLVAAVAPAACVLTACIGYAWSMQVAPRMLPEIAGLEPFRATNTAYPPVTRHGVLLGDSHVQVIARQLQDRARQAGSQLNLIARAGCAPVFQADVIDQHGWLQTYCPEFFRRIVFNDAEFLVVLARWNFYLGLPPSDPFYRSSVLAAAKGTDPLSDPYEVMERGLTLMIAEAKRSGIKRVLIIGPSPEFPVHPPYCLMRSIRVGVESCAVSRMPIDTRRARTMQLLHKVATGFEGVRVVDPIELFCGKTECRPNEGRTLYFSDSNHLSAPGFRRLYAAHENEFVWVLTGQAKPGAPAAVLQ